MPIDEKIDINDEKPDIDELLCLEIRHFKLTNGEELVGFVMSADRKEFIVHQPYIVEISNGRFSTKPWFQLSDQTIFKIKRDTLIQSSVVANFIKKRFIDIVKADYGIIDNDYDNMLDDTDSGDYDDDFDLDFILSNMGNKKILH
jgi:hypothetical protein